MPGARRRRGTGSAPERRACRLPSASTRARTSARWATPARSSPTTPALAERVRVAARARADGQVPPRLRRLHVAARHDPGARAAPQAAAPRRLERRATPGAAAYYLERLDGCRRPRPARRCRRERAGLASATSCGRPIPAGLAALPRGARRRRRAATTPIRCTSRLPTATSGTRRARSRSPSRLAEAHALAADLPGHDASSSSTSRQRRRGVLRRWLTDPVNDAPYRLIATTSSSARASSSRRSRTSTAAAIGDDTRIGTFVEIQRGAVIGARCKIQSHTFICDGVTIEDEVFVGHGVMFVNDKRPRATTDDGALQTDGRLGAAARRSSSSGASIGSGAVDPRRRADRGRTRSSAPERSSRETSTRARSSSAPPPERSAARAPCEAGLRHVPTQVAREPAARVARTDTGSWPNVRDSSAQPIACAIASSAMRDRVVCDARSPPARGWNVGAATSRQPRASGPPEWNTQGRLDPPNGGPATRTASTTSRPSRSPGWLAYGLVGRNRAMS